MTNVPNSREPIVSYITTAIYYVNAKPHVGHALELFQADVLARYRRALGHDVCFQTGTDENSLKNVQAAEQQGIPTADLVANNAAYFQNLPSMLDISCDNFVRTSVDRQHIEGVYKFWQACAANGDIYQRPYQGLYCIGCEQFYDVEELVDERCPIHGTVPELIEEENYFFRLSRYEDELLALIESGQFQIFPETRRNEVLSFVRQGLRDFSISRSQARARGWGIPVPGDSSQVVYVWFDALTNYITGLGYADDAPQFRQYWLNSNKRVHLIGKDIIRFHAVYWPAMLLAAGLPLPTTLFVHGFITVEGRKMSKSLGNVVDPVEYAVRYGKESLRYYLLRKMPATRDGDFSHNEFIQIYNADLADQLGNLLNRVLSMITRYSHGKTPEPGRLEEIDRQLIDVATAAHKQVCEEMAQFAPHRALEAVWSLIAASNKYIVEVEPWVLARKRGQDGREAGIAAERLATLLHILAEILRLLAQYLIPFLPDTAAAIAWQLGVHLVADKDWQQSLTWGQLLPGTTVKPAAVLFPKQEIEHDHESG